MVFSLKLFDKKNNVIILTVLTKLQSFIFVWKTIDFKGKKIMYLFWVKMDPNAKILLRKAISETEVYLSFWTCCRTIVQFMSFIIESQEGNVGASLISHTGWGLHTTYWPWMVPSVENLTVFVWFNFISIHKWNSYVWSLCLRLPAVRRLWYFGSGPDVQSADPDTVLLSDHSPSGWRRQHYPTRLCGGHRLR